jgi:hypothetical protein
MIDPIFFPLKSYDFGLIKFSSSVLFYDLNWIAAGLQYNHVQTVLVRDLRHHGCMVVSALSRREMIMHVHRFLGIYFSSAHLSSN